MNSSVIVFPGSNCDRDIAVALEKLQFKNKMVWHKESELPKSDLIVIPGGFSYGDYLRSGAIAGKSLIVNEVIKAANKGCLVLGICNVVGSSIARIADDGVYSRAGLEIGVASTKAFTSQLLVLFMMIQGWTSHKIRASMSLCLACFVSVATIGFYPAGLYTEENVSLIGISILPLIVGSIVGAKIASKLNESLFRKSTVSLIFASCVVILLRELNLTQYINI